MKIVKCPWKRCLFELENGNLDVFVQTAVAADYLIETSGYTEKIEKAAYKYGEIHPSYFVISRKSPYLKRAGDFEKKYQAVCKRAEIHGDCKKVDALNRRHTSVFRGFEKRRKRRLSKRYRAGRAVVL